MAIKVNLENQNKKREINLTLAGKIAKQTLSLAGKGEAEVNIVFVSNQKIRALNRKYLRRDNSTDVIAFSASRDNVLREIGQNKFLGDVAISSDKALQNAKEYNVTFIEEIARYIIHGVLHLMGYDDVKTKARALMRKKEDAILQKVRKIL